MGVRVVPVDPRQNRHIEGHAEAGLSMLEEVFEAAIGVVGCHNHLEIEVWSPGPQVLCLSVPVTDSLSPPVPCLLPDSWSFYDNRQRFSTSDTEAGQPSSGAAGLHGIEQGRENPRAGGADRMAQRDRPTVDVDPLVVKPQFPVN